MLIAAGFIAAGTAASCGHHGNPGRELSWTGASMGFKVIHRHLLDDAEGGGTHLRCEESMAGLLLTLVYSEARLRAALATWLTAVKTAAER